MVSKREARCVPRARWWTHPFHPAAYSQHQRLADPCRWRGQEHQDRYQLTNGRAHFRGQHGQNLVFKNVAYK